MVRTSKGISPMKRFKVVFVQPVQSPYWTERLQTLAQHKELDLVLLLEHAGFRHRPGWDPVPIEDVKIEVLDSALVGVKQKNPELGYSIQGVRSVAWQLPFRLFKLKPDIVVVCNTTQLLLALPMRPWLGYRIVLNVEDTLHATRRHGRFARLVRSWVYRRTDRFLAFSEEAEKYLHSIDVSGTIDRTSWSLDMNKFHAVGDGRETLGQSCNFQEKIRVLFVGALVPSKGMMPLLHSWARLPVKIRSRSVLQVVGTGPLAQEAKSFTQEQGITEVEFMGSVPYKQMPEFYSSADLFILPTLQDLYSLTVLEAMACGCPVITTPYNGAKELVTKNETGWLVDPSDTKALTDVLRFALEDPVRLAEMGDKASARVEQMDNVLVMSRLKDSLLDFTHKRRVI